MTLKIEFGCGENTHNEEFKTCDIRALPEIDFVCAAWDIDKHVEPESVDEIYSRHFFEHLTFKQGRAVLQAWHKILKPSGIVTMSMPNILFHIDEWMNKRNDPVQFSDALAGFWGWQRGEFDDVWDVHKSGYDEQSLTTLLKDNGFQNVETWTRKKGRHLHARFSK